MEIWKDIVGYENLYQVSNLGRIKSVERKSKTKGNSYRTLKERILKPAIVHNGYERVCLFKDKKGKCYRVNRLVAEAFIKNPNNLTQVNHKDENKLNNRVDNLEWCSASYNINYGDRNNKVAKKVSIWRKKMLKENI